MGAHFLHMKKLTISILMFFSFSFSVFANEIVGEKIPNIVAKDQEGKEIKLVDLKGKWILLYFYPKDDTPGCTKQACSIRDNYSKFKKSGIIVYGVSSQDSESHKKFRAKHKLPFDLLVDNDGKIGKAFGIDKYPLVGIYKRESVLITPDQVVLKKFENVDPDTHTDLVLNAVLEAGGLK